MSTTTSSTSSPTTEEGHKVIPGSRRPDGTFRKEVKVRAGYVPQDEVARYESKGKKYMREVAAIGVVGDVASEEDKTKSVPSKSAKKNAKRKEKKKEATGGFEISFDEDVSEVKKPSNSKSTKKESSTPSEVAQIESGMKDIQLQENNNSKKK